MKISIQWTHHALPGTSEKIGDKVEGALEEKELDKVLEQSLEKGEVPMPGPDLPRREIQSPRRELVLGRPPWREKSGRKRKPRKRKRKRSRSIRRG